MGRFRMDAWCVHSSPQVQESAMHMHILSREILRLLAVFFDFGCQTPTCQCNPDFKNPQLETPNGADSQLAEPKTWAPDTGLVHGT